MNVSTQHISSRPSTECPSVGAIWVWALSGALLGYLVCRRRPWLTLFILPGASVLPLFALLACPNDEDLSLGAVTVSYSICATVALVIAVAGVLAGAVAGRISFWSLGDVITRRRSHSRNGAEPKSSRPGRGGAV